MFYREGKPTNNERQEAVKSACTGKGLALQNYDDGKMDREHLETARDCDEKKTRMEKKQKISRRGNRSVLEFSEKAPG